MFMNKNNGFIRDSLNINENELNKKINSHVVNYIGTNGTCKKTNEIHKISEIGNNYPNAIDEDKLCNKYVNN